MTPEQQQIAIAKTCGWTAEQDSNGYWRATNQKSGHASELWLSERNVWSVGIPDYLNDLNAMHEAEKAMNNNDWWKFVEHLTNICGGGTALGISATAAQRAEAFLRTLGLWEEAQ